VVSSHLRSERGVLLSRKFSIGLPPVGKYGIDLNPSRLVFRNQSIKGTLVASLQDIDETLDFAKRGMTLLPEPGCSC
jgi:D-arabinose 1-dehydrogenase-like Zn-dependent alcohol dehydrogenase